MRTVAVMRGMMSDRKGCKGEDGDGDDGMNQRIFRG